MRNLLTIGLIYAMTVLSGCVTSSTGQKTLDVERVARIAGAAAQIGSQAYLQKHPDQLASFVVAYEALGALDASGNYEPAAFAAALQNLPIKELQGPDGSVYVSVALVVWDELATQTATVDKTTWVKPVLKSVRAGLGRTLGRTP